MPVPPQHRDAGIGPSNNPRAENHCRQSSRTPTRRIAPAISSVAREPRIPPHACPVLPLTRTEGTFLRRRRFTGRARTIQLGGCGTGFDPGCAAPVRTYPSPASTEAAASAWPSPSGARAALKRSKNAFEVDFAKALTRRDPSCAILPRIWTSTV